MLRRSVMVVGLGLWGLSANAAENCTYKVKKESAKLTWTGYKFTEKTGVNGSFDTITFEQNDKAKSLKELFESVTFNVEVASINSALPYRDKKLALFLFGGMRNPGVITGKVSAFNPDDNTASALITMNEASVPTKFTVEKKDQHYTLKSEVDLVGFKMDEGIKNLIQACKDLHVGKDGKEKTWTTVGLSVEADVEKSCTK